jgi:diguanylate cyclase (GGDEF)-like protein
MVSLRGTSRRVFGTVITSDRDLRNYVLRTSLLCVGVAVAVDVINQLIFFLSWSEAFRSWAISAVLAGAIAALASLAIGRAHLRLFRANQVAEQLSRTDPLTGLPNRRALLDGAEAPEAMVLVIFDIDRFKRINDTYGHLAGDEVIRGVAETMAADLEGLGQLGRLGGEEFALLARGTTPEALAAKLAAFRDHVATTPIIVGGTAVNVTISAGVALKAPNGTFTQLYSDADRALYLAKAAGRNRINFAETPDTLPRRREGDPPERSVA